MKTFSDKVRDIVRKIPKGKTLTYTLSLLKPAIRKLHARLVP